MGGKGRGRPADSDHIKHLRGTFRPDRAQTGQEAGGSPAKNPRAPFSLGKAGKLLWKKLCAVYHIDNGAPEDLDLLKKLCQKEDDISEARAMIERDGPLLTNERTGQQYTHPAVGWEARALTSYLAILKKLPFPK